MKIINDDMSLADFNAWSGAVETQDTILKNNKGEEFDDLIAELYPEGITDTQLNDILWFEEEWIFKSLGISDNDEEENEDNE